MPTTVEFMKDKGTSRRALAVVFVTSLAVAMAGCSIVDIPGSAGEITAAGAEASAEANAQSPTPGADGRSGPATAAGGQAAVKATTRPTRVAPAHSDATVSMFGPGYDAPGSVVPVVVTVSERTSDRVDVSFDGGAGTCDPRSWQHTGGTSVACWVTLKRTPGDNALRARAVLTGADGTARQTSAGTLTIKSKGVPTQPVPADRRAEISRCGNTTQNVWLTFDDGFLSRSTMDSMLATLRAKNVRGHFFATGDWARTHPRMIADLRAAGHIVGNHTRSHEPLSGLGEAALRDQIAGGPRADAPALLRPGYGAGGFAARVDAAAARQGLGLCYWTVDTRDWEKPSAERLIDRVLIGDRYTPPIAPGGVVLMHMSGRYTAQALPGLIDGIRAKGLTLEPLR